MSDKALMTPTPGLHACPGSSITVRVFGHTPDRLYSLQSCWEYFAANSTWPYTKLTGIYFPSGPRVRPRPCGLGQPSCTASSPWPRPPWRLDGRPISSVIGSTAALPEASLQGLQGLRAGRQMATRPGRRLSSPAELVRAVARAREEGHP